MALGQSILEQDYHLFDALGADYGHRLQVVQPRGLPRDAWDVVPSCTDRADRLIEPVAITVGEHNKRDKPRAQWFDDSRVVVDLHFGHSWVTADELSEALERATRCRAGIGVHDVGCPKFRAALAPMRSLEGSGLDTRLVYWFA